MNILVEVKHRRIRYFLEMRVYEKYCLKLKKNKRCTECGRPYLSDLAPILESKDGIEINDEFFPFYNIYVKNKKTLDFCHNEIIAKEIEVRFFQGDFCKNISKALKEYFLIEYSLCEECSKEKHNPNSWNY